MRYKYSTKQGIFETNDIDEIPWSKLHSLNNEPAFENLSTGWKAWYFEGNLHRENGPARIWSDEDYDFCLNHIRYENVNYWLRDNPKQDITFQTQMRLKYT